MPKRNKKPQIAFITFEEDLTEILIIGVNNLFIVFIPLYRLYSLFLTGTKRTDMTTSPLVSIIMGSQSDWGTMTEAAKILQQLDISYEKRIISAHRTPQRLVEFASSAKPAGRKVIIAGAGGAAHLPGMVASMTPLPVLGVPIESKALNGLDSLLSIVQMPGGIPVATLAIGTAGAKNAGLLAASILALHDETIANALAQWRQEQTQAIKNHPVE